MLQFRVYDAKRTRIRLIPILFAIAMLASAAPCRADDVFFFSGNLRTNATVIDCGTDCTLNRLNSDYDYAQSAAVIRSFNVTSTSTMTAITYSFGGGTSVTGATVLSGGLEPYLSLFDADGNFLASTYFGTTCPTGANIYDGNCFDVSLDGGTLDPGTYLIALTAYGNMSIADNYGYGNLSDGFGGLGSLADDEDLYYAYDVILTSTSTSTSPVPEPNYAFLAGIALVAPLFLSRMKLRADTPA